MSRYAHLSLHPESIAYLEFLETYNNPNCSTIEEKRLERNKRCEYTTFTERQFDLERTEIHVPSQDVKDGIPVYVYTPRSLPDIPTFLVYFHGGGSVLGNRMMVDTVCKVISQDAECIVLNVEYRLAPEHPAPAQMDDGVTVVRWLLGNKLKLGGSDRSKVGVGGDSAGGRISASVAHDVSVDFQVLVYPNVSPSRGAKTESVEKYKDGPILTEQVSRWFADLAVPKGQETNPRIAASLRKRFEHLPPALIIIAEHDPLSDSAMGYAETLRKAGVSVECDVYKGAIHGFFPYLRMYPELAGRAHAQVVDFIRRIKNA